MKIISISAHRPTQDSGHKRDGHTEYSRPNIKRNFDALTIAQNEFGTAFDRDQMKLRGRAIRLNDLMQEVNRMRIATGRPQVLYNPQWEVKP
jgi:hypothetical protein